MVKNQSSCGVLGLSPRCHSIVAEGIPQTLVEKNLEKLEAPKRSPLLQELESETKETVSKLKMCSHQFEQITSPPQIRQNLPVQHNSTTTRHASIFGDPLNTALSRCSMVGTPRTPQMTLQSGRYWIFTTRDEAMKHQTMGIKVAPLVEIQLRKLGTTW